MPEEQDDRSPEKEITEEQAPPAESSTADETPDPKEAPEAEEKSQDGSDDAEGTATNEAADDSEDGEDDNQEVPMIPLDRHKKILENARRGNKGKESKDSASDTQGGDGDKEDDDIELSPAAQKMIDRQVERRLEKEREDQKQAELDRNFQREVSRLGKAYDGKKDGLPAFDLDKVVAHGRKVGIYNLEKAYRDLNATAIEQSIRKQVSKEYAENPPASSDRPGSSSGAREARGGQEQRVDMRDRSQVVARIRKARQQLEAGRS